MATFVGTYVNKVDSKGRVSVPSRFRDAVAGQSYRGVVVAPSTDVGALDACDYERITEVAAALDDPDLYTAEQRQQAENILARSVELPFDDGGRILLPQELLKHAGIQGQAMFVGIGPTFQIWNPERRREHEARFAAGPAAGASLRLLPKLRRSR
ncbi:MAG TPA: division/cell wall cluster transcriptional repressor MraZ [Alphaproteobacteria bacterium]|jgi:MraZ protein